jgi:hypothetical protein
VEDPALSKRFGKVASKMVFLGIVTPDQKYEMNDMLSTGKTFDELPTWMKEKILLAERSA